MLKISHEIRSHLARHEFNACFDWTTSAVSLQRNLHTFRVHQRTSSLIFCRGGRKGSLKEVMMSAMNKTWLEAVFKCTFLNWCLLCWETFGWSPNQHTEHYLAKNIHKILHRSFLSIIVTLQPVCKEQTGFYRNRCLTLSQRSEYGDSRHVLSLLELSHLPPKDSQGGVGSQ